jgi:hypothetical protein
VFTLRVALPTFIQPYHPAPCSPMCCRRSRYHSSRPIYTRTQAPCRQNRLSTIPLPGHHAESPRQTNPDSLSLLSLPAQQSTPLLSIHSIRSIPLLQVRTATSRDSPDRYDNLIDRAPLLHRFAILPRKNNNIAFLPSLVNCEHRPPTTTQLHRSDQHTCS